MKAAVDGSYLLVAAFDFGTTYSGYAFSFRDNPDKIQTNSVWSAASGQLLSLKTPTCILLKPDKTFHSFGFAAEDKYAELATNDEQHGWLFFRHFKMLLHNNKELCRETTIEDISGTKMKAMTIFALSIRYLRDHLLEELKKQRGSIEETDIFYVLTIPAIWDDSAKQFMRETAIEAEIDTNRLKLALEPEAASIWCQRENEEIRITLAQPVIKYMVVDLGGGTADITVHEKVEDGSLKEICKANGGPWGGMYVDKNYLKFYEQIFGERAMECLLKEDKYGYIDLLRSFETKKRSITSNSNQRVVLDIPSILGEESEKEMPIERRIESLNLKEKPLIKHGRLHVNSDIVHRWFEEPVTKLLERVRRILLKPKIKDVSTILLVGGFSVSKYVQERFKEDFPNQHIIVPSEADLAVLKGAVRFGHMPNIVSSRVSKYTYGIAVTDEYDEHKYPSDKMEIIDGQKRVLGVFDAFVKVGQSVKTGHQRRERHTPLTMDKSTVLVFRSTDRNPKFVTDANCAVLGILEIEHPEGNTLEDKECEIIFTFGGTELKVEGIVLKTNKKYCTSIDCLNKDT